MLWESVVRKTNLQICTLRDFLQVVLGTRCDATKEYLL